MKEVRIALSDEQADWAADQVASGSYPSIDAYFAALTSRDRADVETSDWLERQIAEGLASGTDPRSADDIFADAMRWRGGSSA